MGRRRCGSFLRIEALIGVSVAGSLWLSVHHTAHTNLAPALAPGRTLGSLNSEPLARQSSPMTKIPSEAVEGSRARWHEVAGSRSFEPSDCPRTPDPNYPREFPILNVTGNWNPDDPTIPARHHASLCRFDYQNEFDIALAYRKAEVPFLVHNVPGADDVVGRWSDPQYLSEKLGTSKRYLTEYSEDNHFMYFSGSHKSPKGWKAPVENRRMTFRDWFTYAVQHNNESANTPHMYFRFSTLDTGHWLKDDLEMLTPKTKSLFIVDSANARGIHCRFGMRGINAAAHFDGSRNFVAVFGGYRRYMMASPHNCHTTYLYPSGHPSGRHSEVDWSDPDLEKFPEFPKSTVSEVILTAGDFMYIPSGWIHYIMSMNVNWQCNARSGKGPTRGKQHLAKCGFHS